eukprot:COSAG02_NODE_162_length_32474_cov_13.222511_1_plen_149_part_00
MSTTTSSQHPTVDNFSGVISKEYMAGPSLFTRTDLIGAEFRYSLDGASDITFVLSQSETPYWQNPPTALAMKIHDSKNIRSYGAAYECWFHGIETSLLEVVGSPSTFLYLPNTKNASHIVSGDTEVLAADPRYNITGHFTQSFVASIP